MNTMKLNQNPNITKTYQKYPESPRNTEKVNKTC